MTLKPVVSAQAQPAAAGPTATLPKDPQPSIDRVEELARRILTGDILLPKFQREFVWERQQILDLLDSIFRNYPIGSVLLWQSRQELRSENRIADLEIQLPRPDYPVNYLLDGQQRLSTLCAALYWHGSNPTSQWNIAFDLRAKEFIHLDTIDDPPLHQVKMNKLADPSEYFKHVSSLDTLAAPDKENLKETAGVLFNRFKDYKIATVTLGDMPIEDVAPIFERINSTGTRLTMVELMRAATWSQDFDLVDTIDAILEDLSIKGFGGLERKTVLRSLSAAAGGKFSAESIDNLRNYDADALKIAAGATEEAYKRAVDFLSTQINIPNDTILPYANQIVVLSEIFRLIPSPNAQQFTAIHHWFWQSSVTGYFSGWNTGDMATDQRSVQAFAEGDISTIEISEPPTKPSLWYSRIFRTNNAHAKILAILLSYHRPKDLLTGQDIDTAKALAWANSKEYHHFFPKDYLRSKSVPSEKINCLANFVMLSSVSNKRITNRAPSDYLKDVADALGPNLESVLASNLISLDAYKAALVDDFDNFLKLRALTIDEQVKRLTGWS